MPNSTQNAISHPQFAVAVIVTYNRISLLLQCLERQLAQTRRPDLIIIIDNASTDGTEDTLRSNNYLDDPLVSYTRIAENKGGAYGFALGIQLALQRNADWIWLMDDDTLPLPKALECLLDASRKIEQKTGQPPALLASHVRWTDGSPHPMNWPVPKVRPEEHFFLSVDTLSSIPIRSTSFVSCLVNGRVARDEDPPIPGYFIWNDDVEYTSRLLKHRNGYFVPASIVIHATKKRYTSHQEIGDRFFFEVRNKIWMICRSNCLYPDERFRFAKSLAANVVRFIAANRFSPNSMKIVSKALLKSLSRPSREL